MKGIPEFNLPYDLSEMGKPTMEALDANFDYVGEYMRTHVFPALVSATMRIEELEVRVSILDRLVS